MKTLEEIKDEVCIDYGYFNYQSAVEAFKNGTLKVVLFNSLVNEIGRSVAREALKNAAEKLEYEYCDYDEQVDYSFITEETNIPKL